MKLTKKRKMELLERYYELDQILIYEKNVCEGYRSHLLINDINEELQMIRNIIYYNEEG